MAQERSRGFFFNVEQWFGSVTAQRMSFAEKGVYLSMLFQQWRETTKSLPDNPRELGDLIAVSEAQVQEIEQAWPVVRRKFTTIEGSGRILNVKLEQTRRIQVANLRKRAIAGRVAGKASAAKRLRAQMLPSNDSLTSVERPSTDLTRSDQKRLDQKRKEEREIARAPASPVLAGSLPRDHRTHVFCDESFTVCVPAPVHAKFLNPLARKFSGDREQAHQALMTWYRDVAQTLPADQVVGDAFKFWQPLFDAQFATEQKPSRMLSTPSLYEQCRHEPQCSSWSQHDVKTRLDTGKVSKP